MHFTFAHTLALLFFSGIGIVASAVILVSVRNAKPVEVWKRNRAFLKTITR